MRRIKRHHDFEITLQLPRDEFIAPPRELQRNWVVNRALDEFASNLSALDGLARHFVPGSSQRSEVDRRHDDLSDQQIMEDWQIPIMEAMAELVGRSRGDVLEIGFGRGVSAELLQRTGVRSHTVVECNPAIIERFHRWKANYPNRDIRLLPGRWQDVLDPSSRQYDGAFFHTYPLDEQEFVDQVVRSTTFGEHFFATAAALLRQGGVFTYLTNEIDSLSRPHQRSLFRHFREISVRVVNGLNLPEDVQDSWWANSMVVVGATK